MMTTKLTQKEMDANFHDWLTELVEDPEVDADVKRVIVRDLCETRHVVVVETLNFFPELHGDARYEEEAPYAVVSKAYPTMVTVQFEEFQDVLDFCADHGLTYDVNLTRSSSMVH